MFDLDAVFIEDRAKLRLIEHQAPEPLGVFACPGAPFLVDIPMADQQTVESLAGTLEVRLGAFPAAGQLPVRLLGRIGGIDLRQLSGSELTEQLPGVPSIRLDPIPGLRQTSEGAMTFATQPSFSNRRLSTNPQMPAS